MLNTITKTKNKTRARATVQFAREGWGKSTFAVKLAEAAGLKNVFINLDDGIGDLDALAFPVASTLLDLQGQLVSLGGEAEHDFTMVTIDTIDVVQQLIFDQVATEAGKNSIAEISYGKGYELAAEKFSKVLVALDDLRKNKNMQIFILAHAVSKKAELPGSERFDRWSLRLHDRISLLLTEWADEVLFGTFQEYTKKETGRGERNIAVGGAERIIHTERAATYDAKNRLGLDPTIPCDPVLYSSFWSPKK